MFHSDRPSLVVFALACGLALTLLAGSASAIDPMFAGLTLIDEVNCGNPADPHTLTESAAGASAIQTILGRQCRVLTPTSSVKYFSYRLGQNMGLAAGGAYILLIEYPEDQPRSMWVVNSGNEQTNGYHTGTTVGDALDPEYVTNNSESLNYPLSQQYQALQMFFNLHHRYPNIVEGGTGAYPLTPANGIPVTIAQFKSAQDPTSAGAAVARIALYAAPSFATYALPINFPPSQLPRRHLFWREEMSDGVIKSTTTANRGTPTDAEWYEYKAKLSKFLGMNTFSKDLFEFGNNQGWDSSLYGGSQWVFQNAHPQRWSQTLDMLGKPEYADIDVMPYYEYCGSQGSNSSLAIGIQRRCRPLTDTSATFAYTHIAWSEEAYCDVTDPDFVTDIQRVLDCTINQLKQKKTFSGAWFRTRVSNMPLSFADAALARFAAQANGGVAVTRTQISADATLYNSYTGWWREKRHQYLNAIRDYIRTNVNPQAEVLFTWDGSEPGIAPNNGGRYVISDDSAYWETQGKTAVPLANAVAQHRNLWAMLLPRTTFDPWEWQHSLPVPDPENYQNTEGVMLTHTFHKAYTVGDPTSMDTFRTQSGLAMIRHYSLNENMMRLDSGTDILGYFVGDMNLAGPFEMSAEAQAVANGDPKYIGYLAGSSYNRCFPQYVRKFNQAFLSLPALPSVVMAGAASNPQVVVRSITTTGQGIYLAVVNNGMTSVSNVTVNLPRQGVVTDAAVNAPMTPVGSVVTLGTMYPYELRTIRISGSNLGPMVYAGQDQVSADGNLSVTGTVSDDGTIAPVTYGWSTASGPANAVFTNAGALTTAVRLPQPGVYVLRLTAYDGQYTQIDDMTVMYELDPQLKYDYVDLGSGVCGWRFWIATGDGQQTNFSVVLGFQGTGGATIQQIKSGAVHVSKEGWKEWNSEMGEWDGEGAILCEEVDPAYDIDRDTWACNPFGDNAVPGTNPITGLPLTGIYNAANAFAMSCSSGTGSQLGYGADVAYVVATGNVTWTAKITRIGEVFQTSGTTQIPALYILGDFNADGTVTHGDYTVWADNYGLSIAAVQAAHPTWFPLGSYPAGATMVTQGLYTTWADHFGDTAPLTVGQSSLPAVADEPAAVNEAAPEEPKLTGQARAQQRMQRRLERRALRDLRKAEKAATKAAR